MYESVAKSLAMCKSNAIICSIIALCLGLVSKADNWGVMRLHSAQVYNKPCLAGIEKYLPVLC